MAAGEEEELFKQRSPQKPHPIAFDCFLVSFGTYHKKKKERRASEREREGWGWGGWFRELGKWFQRDRQRGGKERALVFFGLLFLRFYTGVPCHCHVGLIHEVARGDTVGDSWFFHLPF